MVNRSTSVLLDDAGRPVLSADGPTFMVVWATAGHLAGQDLLLPEHLLLAALHHSGIAGALRGPIETAREKLLRAAREAGGEEDLEAAGVCAATVEVVDRARHRAGERGRPTMLRDLLEALRASGGVFEEVLVAGDLGPLERKSPKRPPAEAASTTPYRTASRHVDVYVANDAVSSTESVVEILEGVFALPTTAALYATYETHYCGFGWVGRWSRETAGELVHRARERAAARQSPLTFVTEEAADG